MKRYFLLLSGLLFAVEGQEIFRGCESFGHKADLLHETSKGVAHQFIVIDDDNHFCLFLSCHD